MGNAPLISEGQIEALTAQEVDRVIRQTVPGKTPIFSKQFSFSVNSTSHEFFTTSVMGSLVSGLSDFNSSRVYDKSLQAIITREGTYNEFHFRYTTNLIEGKLLIIGYGYVMREMFRSSNSVFIGIYPA